MGTYEPGEFMELFGGMPERGESAVDVRALADEERDAATDPKPCGPGRCSPEGCHSPYCWTDHESEDD